MTYPNNLAEYSRFVVIPSNAISHTKGETLPRTPTICTHADRVIIDVSLVPASLIGPLAGALGKHKEMHRYAVISWAKGTEWVTHMPDVLAQVYRCKGTPDEDERTANSDPLQRCIPI